MATLQLALTVPGSLSAVCTQAITPLLAAEAGRCVVLRSLMALDGALEGDPVHEGYSANVMP